MRLCALVCRSREESGEERGAVRWFVVVESFFQHREKHFLMAEEGEAPPAEGEEGVPKVVEVPAGPIASAELLEACMLQGKSMKVRSYIAKHDAEEVNWPTTKNGWSCLQVAAGYGNPDTIRALVELGAKIDTKDKLGMTPLHSAADTDETEVMRALLETDAGKALVNEQDLVRACPAAMPAELALFEETRPRTPSNLHEAAC